MKVQDLRVGNLVYRNNNIEVELHIEHLRRINNGSKVFKPIPLTEQRLIEFGFEKREDGDYNLFKQSEVDIVLKEDFSSWTCDGINFSVNYIEYVHQLQNLYYSLTGNELK